MVCLSYGLSGRLRGAASVPPVQDGIDASPNEVFIRVGAKHFPTTRPMLSTVLLSLTAAPPSHPIFYMSHNHNVGDRVDLHFFEARYKILIRRTWDSSDKIFVYCAHPPFATAGRSFDLPIGQEPPNERCVAVHVESAEFYADGQADISGRAVAEVSLEDAYLEKGTGGLFSTQTKIDYAASLPTPAEAHVLGASPTKMRGIATNDGTVYNDIRAMPDDQRDEALLNIYGKDAAKWIHYIWPRKDMPNQPTLAETLISRDPATRWRERQEAAKNEARKERLIRAFLAFLSFITLCYLTCLGCKTVRPPAKKQIAFCPPPPLSSAEIMTVKV